MERDQKLWTLFQIDQQRIGALDTNMITIRGWVITLTAAIAGVSLSQHHRDLLLVAMAGAVLFGVLDARYRSTQLLHASRADKIEQDLAPEGYTLRLPDPRGTSWLSILSRSRYRSSVSFYVIVILLLFLLWLLI